MKQLLPGGIDVRPQGVPLPPQHADTPSALKKSFPSIPCIRINRTNRGKGTFRTFTPVGGGYFNALNACKRPERAPSPIFRA